MPKYKIEIKQPFATVKTQYIDFMFENYHLLTAEDLVSYPHKKTNVCSIVANLDGI